MSDRGMGHSAPKHVSADAICVTVLTLVAMVQGYGYWRSGLSYSPDSGQYMLYAARLRGELDYGAGDPSYAPLFPVLMAIIMLAVTYPGQAAVILIALSAWAASCGAYVAMRLSSLSPFSAICWCAFLIALESSQHVFGFAWTEGLLLADLCVLLAALQRWLRLRSTLACAVVWAAAAAAPLIKYVAIFVPVVVVFLVVLHARSLRLIAATVLCTWIPCIVVFAYNRYRWNVLTGHPVAARPVQENLTQLWRTLQASFGTQGIAFVALCLGLGALAQLLDRTPLRRRLANPFVISMLHCVGYFVCLIAAASSVKIDMLDMRLAAPGSALVVLAAAQGTGALLRSARMRCQRMVSSVAAGVLWLGLAYVICQPGLKYWARIYGLVAASPEASTLSYQSGFAASSARAGAASFLEAELRDHSTVSVTQVNAEPKQGRVRREWYSIASALALPAVPDDRDARIAYARREQIVISLAGNHRLIFLPARLPELHALRKATRREVRDRVNEIIARAVKHAKKYDRSSHWLLIPEVARWFNVATGDMFDGAYVDKVQRLAGYTAVQLSIQ